MSEITPEQAAALAVNEQKSLHAQVELAQLTLAAGHDNELRLFAALSERRKTRAAYMARFEDGSVLPQPSKGPRHG